jgi:hypothetical protein
MVAILLFFFRSLTGFVAVFLVRGFAKVRGEWSLMALCYNFSRVLSILGFDRWLAVLAVRTRNPRGMLFLALATVPRQLSRFAAAICRAFQAVSMVQLHGATALRVDIVANILHFLPSLELLPSREVLYPLHSHRGADDNTALSGTVPASGTSWRFRRRGRSCRGLAAWTSKDGVNGNAFRRGTVDIACY